MDPYTTPLPQYEPQVDETTKQLFKHSSAKRVSTDSVIAQALKKQYPNLELVIAPSGGADLLSYALSGHATFSPIDQDAGAGLPSSVIWKSYAPPARRIDGNPGSLVLNVEFAKYLYKWNGHEFIVYLVDGRDGTAYYPNIRNNYILTTDSKKADALIMAAGKWGNELHNEIWVWDRSTWTKSAELYQSVMNASWDAVILDSKMKKTIIDDHESFFNSRSTFDRLKVPWKRGIIYHGPPGNGKTISIKATMHMLYERKDPVPSLYVRSFFSFMGPEYAISSIFLKARQLAPCYLIFEDLDSIVTDAVRSYFLNEVDGLKSNDGIFMIGSTNHLDRLDPGISKRPSRFDRKYLFPDPDMDQRIAYCKFWQSKLAKNEEIEFPDQLCKAIAEITHGFSFAYIQEAFVAALLAIARGGDGASDDAAVDDEGWVGVGFSSSGEDDDIKTNVLWIEIQKQVAILREGMEEKKVKGSTT